jgi:hypothetical protein
MMRASALEAHVVRGEDPHPELSVFGMPTANHEDTGVAVLFGYTCEVVLDVADRFEVNEELDGRWLSP